MEYRELRANIIPAHYFEPSPTPFPPEEGCREMGQLYPFLISGGSNTERYYFTHINEITDYKFYIRPQYFSDESNYTAAFPKRINEILKDNPDAHIFCVFDWDTICFNEKNRIKHLEFEKQFKSEIQDGSVILCPSMPSIEYWFLLHFENYTDLLKNYSKVSNRLAIYKNIIFPDKTEKLKKLFKKGKYLIDSSWVKKLCEDDRLQTAIERAEANIAVAEANGKLDEQSFSFVYKVFRNNSLP